MWSILYGILFVVLVEARGLPTVETNHGVVRGNWLSSSRNLTVAAFLGIPYAKPPIGELRFQVPQPWTHNWTEIRDTVKDGSMCVQLNREMNIFGNEDCLYLNIFVPVTANDAGLPVLVFVHGGGFNIGSNNSTIYAPDYLMDQEIILVTVNYRLGIFGFLSSGTSAAPGNLGLKDIVQALKWINENIAHFGGDPASVTIAGQSAGAAAVHHLALSQSTEGLFQRYITHSGSAFASWAIHSPFFMRMRFLIVAQELDCISEEDAANLKPPQAFDFSDDFPEENLLNDDIVAGDEKIINCLKFKSSTQLVHVMTLFHTWKINPTCNFGPTVEIGSEDPIIKRHPQRTVELREFRDIPWITGVVADEGLLKTAEMFRNRAMLDEFMQHFEDYASLFLEYEEVVENRTLFAEALQGFYFPPEMDSDDIISIDRNLTRMAGDGMISWPSYHGLNLQIDHMNSSAYFYVFSYEGTFSSTYNHAMPRRYGVAHCDELNYLFPSLNNYYTDLLLHNTESDWTMINIMTEMWANFVKDGVPSAQLVTEWEPYEKEERYLEIGSGRSTQLKMEKDFLPHRMGFWEYLMTNVSFPMEKLFLESLYDDVTYTGSASETNLSKHLQIIIFTLFIAYEIL